MKTIYTASYMLGNDCISRPFETLDKAMQFAHDMANYAYGTVHIHRHDSIEFDDEFIDESARLICDYYYENGHCVCDYVSV